MTGRVMATCFLAIAEIPTEVYSDSSTKEFSDGYIMKKSIVLMEPVHKLIQSSQDTAFGTLHSTKIAKFNMPYIIKEVYTLC